MNTDRFRDERGFWSALFILLVVALGGLAVATNVVVQRDTEGTVGHALTMQLDYSANAAAYYGIRAFRDGRLNDGEHISVMIGDMACDIFCDRIVDAQEVFYELNVEATNDNGLSRNIVIEIENAIDFAGRAINCEGEAADNLNTVHEGGSTHDPDLLVENTPLPNIHLTDLINDATVIVTKKSQFKDGFPANMTGNVDPSNPFYQADGVTPHIIYVMPGVGIDLKGGGNRVISGIFITDDDFVTNGGHTYVNGVILMTNPSASFDMKGSHGGRGHVHGGVVSYGDVDGKGSKCTIMHKRDYMEHFAQYVEAGLANAAILAWRYQ